jgi:hypothetical protein
MRQQTVVTQAWRSPVSPTLCRKRGVQITGTTVRGHRPNCRPRLYGAASSCQYASNLSSEVAWAAAAPARTIFPISEIILDSEIASLYSNAIPIHRRGRFHEAS